MTPITATRRAPRQGADAPCRLVAVDAGQGDIHQDDVVMARGERREGGLGAGGEGGAVAELGDDRIHHQPAVGIVVDAENRERLAAAARGPAPRRPVGGRGRAPR